MKKHSTQGIKKPQHKFKTLGSGNLVISTHVLMNIETNEKHVVVPKPEVAIMTSKGPIYSINMKLLKFKGSLPDQVIKTYHMIVKKRRESDLFKKCCKQQSKVLGVIRDLKDVDHKSWLHYQHVSTFSSSTMTDALSFPTDEFRKALKRENKRLKEQYHDIQKLIWTCNFTMTSYFCRCRVMINQISGMIKQLSSISSEYNSKFKEWSIGDLRSMFNSYRSNYTPGKLESIYDTIKKQEGLVKEEFDKYH